MTDIDSVVFKDEVLPPRFWSKVQIDPSGCWLWTGATDRKGYGRVGRGSRSQGTIGAHSWMARVAHGEKPSDKHMVLHSCDTPSCVNPDCLRWGLAAENSAEMVARGRSTAKLICVNGHDRTPDNVYEGGACKTCQRTRATARYWRGRAA